MKRLSRSTRKEQEQKLKDFAQEGVIIEFNPAVKTHIGEIDMLDRNANCIQALDKEWIFLGTLADLTDEEFYKVFSSAQKFAERLTKQFMTYKLEEKKLL